MDERDEIPEKKFDRQRKKRFYNNIRQQIEFYLGDVNLSKDRFFANLLQESPYIDIDVILKCNKIKKFTNHPKDIVKALKKSTFLSCTEDGNKIFRTAPVQPVSNSDDCTIYVEDLPLEVDHDWLKNVFSTYGEIVYISIPHYKTSHKLKGFAFIQFDTPESANKALNAFRSVNSCLSNTMEPTELKSIQTFEGEKHVVIRTKGEINTDQIKCLNIEENQSNSEAEDLSSSKRKRESTDSLIQVKMEQNDVEPIKIAAEEPETEVKSVECGKRNIKKMRMDENQEKSSEEMQLKIEISQNQDDENCFEDEKRPHKRKRKKAKKNESVQTFGMQILSKHDWKKLRNKYLEEQRKRMHELKQQLRETHLYQAGKIKSESKSGNEDDDENSEMQVEETKTSECRVKFTPGVIVKLILDQPIKDVKHFKNEVKRYADVEYIDVCENSYLAYFRCASNDIANQVIGLNKWSNMAILKGDEEQAYWEKIRNDRKQKFEQKIRCVTRGKNKLIKKAEAAMVQTHVRFPE